MTQPITPRRFADIFNAENPFTPKPGRKWLFDWTIGLNEKQRDVHIVIETSESRLDDGIFLLQTEPDLGEGPNTVYLTEIL